MERKPFERCGVRCSRRPSRSNSAIASADKNVARRLAGIEREQDGDQAAHDMGVAVAGEAQHRAGRAVGQHRGREPNLAGAALHLVRFAAVPLGERGERPAKLDHIAIAVVPLVEQGEIVDDFVDRRHGLGRGHGPPHSANIDRDIATIAPVARARHGGVRRTCSLTLRPVAPRRASLCGARQAGAASGGASVCCDGLGVGIGTALLGTTRRRAGLVRADMLVEEFVEHLGAGLRPLPERGRHLRADRAGIGLPAAELLHVGDRGGRCRDGVDRR